jgi:hypothetical protein
MRPIIATQLVHRNVVPSNGNAATINIVPIAKMYNVGLIFGGFVNGATRRNLPPDSLRTPYISYPPDVWYEDLFRSDLSPYLWEEMRNIKHFNGIFKKSDWTSCVFLDCPLGYQSKVDNFTCYNALATRLNYAQAKAACENTYSNLVTINSAFENNDLKSMC